MSEMTAKQIREITNNKDEITAEMWYAGFKDVLFERITTAALDGDSSITLQMFEWNNDEVKRKYLNNRLYQLGYSVIGKSSMTISW